MLNLEEIIKTLSQYNVRLLSEYGVRNIGVFGSYARGAQTPESDIDFVVDFADDCQDLFDTKYRLRQFLSGLFDKQVDIANFKAIKPYVLKEIAGDIRYAQ